MANDCFLDPNCTSLQSLAILTKNKNFYIPKFSWPLISWKMTAAQHTPPPPSVNKFIWNFATMCPKGIKESEIFEAIGERVLEFWLTVWWCRPKSPSPLPRPVGNRVNSPKQKDQTLTHTSSYFCWKRQKKSANFVTLNVLTPFTLCHEFRGT